MGTRGEDAQENPLDLHGIWQRQLIDDHIPAKFFRGHQDRGNDKNRGVSVPKGSVNIFQLSHDERIRFHQRMETLEEVEALLLALHDLVQGIQGIGRILDLFIFSDQSMKRIPDVKPGVWLEGRRQLPEQGFDPVLLIREEVDNRDLGQDQSLQVLKDLLFLRGSIHTIFLSPLFYKGKETAVKCPDKKEKGNTSGFRKSVKFVIPVKTGIQSLPGRKRKILDSCFRRNDDLREKPLNRVEFSKG